MTRNSVNSTRKRRVHAADARLISALAALALFHVLAASSSVERDGEVVGLVVGVTARSITEVESLTVVSGDGREWEFVGGEFPGFTPSHLEEHQALGEPVRVSYVVQDDGSKRIVKIEDG